jgi:hypothetical protein
MIDFDKSGVRGIVLNLEEENVGFVLLVIPKISRKANW